MLFLLALAAPAPLQPTSDEPEDSKTGFDWKNAAKLDEAFGLKKWQEHKGVSLCGPYAQMCCCGDNGVATNRGGDLANGQWMGGTISVPDVYAHAAAHEEKGLDGVGPCGRADLPALYGTAANADWPNAFQSLLGGKNQPPKGWLVCHKCSRSELKVVDVSDAYRNLIKKRGQEGGLLTNPGQIAARQVHMSDAGSPPNCSARRRAHGCQAGSSRPKAESARPTISREHSTSDLARQERAARALRALSTRLACRPYLRH